MPEPRSYVILGAAGGIGSELARQLARQNANLALVGRNVTRLDALAAELRELGATNVLTVAADCRESAPCDGAFQRAAEAFGALHGAVNLIGSIILKPAHLTTDAEFQDTLSINLNTSFYFLRAAVKSMMATGGSIVFASTVAARIGLVNHEAIAAAKGGVEALARSAAATYAGRNIRVNVVAPGLVRTPLSARITGSELALKASTAMHPLGRVGEPADVATPIAWLVGPDSGWVTGQVIGIDGGLASVKGK